MEGRVITKKSIEFAGKTITIEIGRMATQANGSVLLSCGDTTVLVTATASKTASENADFFPLTVDYLEKMFAAGKIPGGFFKREAKPTTQATLTARLIDRAIRPFFPDGFRNQVHVVVTILSFDEVNDPAIMGLLGASLALGISDIPFSEPIASVSVGLIDEELRVYPTIEEMKSSDLELVVGGSESSVVMIEAGANELSEEIIMEAIYRGHEDIKKLVAFQKEIIAEIGKEKMEVVLKVIPESIIEMIKTDFSAAIDEAVRIVKKLEKYERIDAIKAEVKEKYQEMIEAEETTEKELAEAYDSILYNSFRMAAVKEGKRSDGRGFDDIRPITCEIDVLPRVHGSALFTRGETQSLGTVTLGSATDEQIIDGLEEEYKKLYFLHYNFPPYSVGEAGFLRPPGRRELGHGALAERALSAVMPTKAEFPYTIRIVSDIMESNGSSSMATVCSGTLALMAAGVPIKKPVAGIANGLIVEGDTAIVLTDIMGMEDHLGDMDFKVTGTRDGITAMQMDIKIEGISRPIMQEALAKAKISRFTILDIMEKTIEQPRGELSDHAPRIESFKVDTDKIGTIIGPGGKMIKAIVEETKVAIDIKDDGTVNISSSDVKAIEAAIQIIKNLTDEPEMNEIYEGTVSRVEAYGAFVKIMGGYKEGLVHVSQIHYNRIDKVEDIIKLGDTLMVRYIGSDKGKVSLTMKGVPGNEALNEKIVEITANQPERPPYQPRERSNDYRGRDRDRGGRNRR